MTMDATRLGNSIVDGMKTVSTFSSTQESASRANMIKLAQAVIDEIEDYYSGGGGGTPSDDNPEPLGTADPGISSLYSRGDHVHPMPDAADVGADPAGTAAAAITTHLGAAPHVALSSATPAALGSASAGTGTASSRDDHRHAMPSAADVGAISASGANSPSSNINWGGYRITNLGAAVSGSDAPTLDQVQGLITGLAWQKPVISATTGTPPASPAIGDRYIVPVGAGGSWSTLDDLIVEWDGATWDQTQPAEGWTVPVQDSGSDVRYDDAFPAGSWVNLGSSIDHAVLINRAWAASGHTGTADRLAAFDGSGAATYKQVGVDVQAYHVNLAQFAGLSLIADRLPYANGTNTMALATFTSLARTFLAASTDTAARSAIGAGTGNGDVTAAANFGTDNSILRADGTGKGAQASAVTINDAGNVIPDADVTQQLGNKDKTWGEVWSLQYTGREQASVQAPSGGWTGRWAFWGKTGTPSEPYYTDDAGTDQRLIMRSDVGTSSTAGVYETATWLEGQTASEALVTDARDWWAVYNQPGPWAGSWWANLVSSGVTVGGSGILAALTASGTFSTKTYSTTYGPYWSIAQSSSAGAERALYPSLTSNSWTFDQAKYVRHLIWLGASSVSTSRVVYGWAVAGGTLTTPSTTTRHFACGIWEGAFHVRAADGTTAATPVVFTATPSNDVIYALEVIPQSATSIKVRLYSWALTTGLTWIEDQTINNNVPGGSGVIVPVWVARSSSGTPSAHLAGWLTAINKAGL